MASDLPGVHEANIQDVTKKRGWFADPKIQSRWEIPEKVVIKVAISGRSATEEEKISGAFPSTIPEFTSAAAEVIEGGAAGIHFDLSNLKDYTGNELDVGRKTVDVYREILAPLKSKFANNFVVDVNILRGRNFEENVSPITQKVAEMGPVAAGYNIEWVTAAIKTMQDNGSKPEIVIHGSGEVGLAKKRLIDTGLLEKPYYFIVLIGTPVDAGLSPFSYSYLPDPFDMCKSLLFITEQIRRIDEESVIIVCAAGRAAHYLTTQAMMLGLHVRVGVEDTVWRYPGKDEVLGGNLEMLKTAMTTAEILGRKPADANDYRKIVGLR
ncbi:MAG: 3-keto-5-aminohexanoate cleavage protein [Nitrososphaerales archaeon]